MALESLSAFAAGVAVGWAGRSLAGSTREALVKAIVAGHKLREDLKRSLGERAEWIEDLLAEGRMRYETTVDEQPVNESEPPVVRHASRDRAA